MSGRHLHLSFPPAVTPNFRPPAINDKESPLFVAFAIAPSLKKTNSHLLHVCHHLPSSLHRCLVATAALQQLKAKSPPYGSVLLIEFLLQASQPATIIIDAIAAMRLFRAGSDLHCRVSPQGCKWLDEIMHSCVSLS